MGRRSWVVRLRSTSIRRSEVRIDPKVPDRYAQIRARLTEVIPDPQHKFIDRLAYRYTGKQFRELEPGEERITFKLEPLIVTGQMI